jgi:fermentation-respiration switch protein FrsA (DUF1100 family)
MFISIVGLVATLGVTASNARAGTDAAAAADATTQPAGAVDSTAAANSADAGAVTAARREMLSRADQRIASLQGLLDQIPADQQPQSQVNQRLQQAIMEKSKIESASDAEIADMAAADRADAAKAAPQDAAPDNAAPSEIEIQLVFPGAQTQGRFDSVVKAAEGCELLTLHAPDGTKIVALFGKAINPRGNGPAPALLYFYGNGTCMADSLDEFDRFRGLGFNVIMPDFEGYGMSDGPPSEAGCYAAADAVYDYLLTRNDVDQKHLVATGWSLGAAVAIDLARRRHVAGLVTFSAFTNVVEMTHALLNGVPLPIQFSSRFDNLAKIKTITCPIFMAHGTQDDLVPPEMLDRLSKAAKSDVTVDRVDGAAHNDIFQTGGDALFQRVQTFVDGLAEVTPTTRDQ